ncbi:hypothetical protein K438DRAFT_2028725 [Mycena galopus ATCC 62051]|nr:hypothetical protein K438DRAFT_2028725 [Mycena galopus ATCC 62051]
MFSRSNHHEQNRAEAPSTYLAPQLCAGDFLTRSDPLSVHYSRLETLLDSACYVDTHPQLCPNCASIHHSLIGSNAGSVQACPCASTVPPTRHRDPHTDSDADPIPDTSLDLDARHVRRRYGMPHH